MYVELACNAALSINNKILQPMASEKPKSKSCWYCRSLSRSRNRNVTRRTWALLSRSTLRASIACDRYLLTRFEGWW